MTPATAKTLSAVRAWLGLAATFAVLVIAWANLKAQVARLEEVKADATDVEALRDVVDRIDERTANMEARQRQLICAVRPAGLGC